MKNRIIKTIFAILLQFIALPMMGQNSMKVCFKDGSVRQYYLEKVIEITTSKVDEDGFSHSDYDYQHVKTTNSTYVFKLSDIESLTFTKISERQTAQSFAAVSQVALDALSDCETIEDAEAKINQIKKSSDVEDAWREGASLYVKSKNGDIIPFHFSHNSLDDADSGAKMIKQAKAFLSRKKAVLKPINTRLKAAIVNQMHKDESRTKQITKYFYPLKELFDSYGIETEYIDSLGIDFFYRTEPKPGEAPRPTMYDFDIVFLMTHGDYNESNNDHLLLLSTELGMERKSGKHPSEDLKKICEDKYFSYKENELGGLLNDMNCLSIGYNEEVRNGHKCFVGYVYLKELFFREKAKDKFVKPVSILFNGACLSLKNNHNLAETLFNKQELDVYLGYDETNFLSDQTGSEWFISLLNGKSLDKAYKDLPEEHKTESSRLTNIPSWNYLNAHLEIGSKSGLDIQNLFLFPTVTKQIEQTTAQNAFNSSGYVEVEGNTTLSDPGADNVVKMGFECSTNENFSPATSVVSSDVIKLTKPLDNGNGNVQFRAKLTDLQPGNTYFYRAFTYDGMNYNYGEPCSFEIEDSGEGAIAYTSCPDSHHPHLIDLGLPSGTKWACCNVGASNPIDNGSYYVWGRTEEYQTEKSLSDFTGSDIAGSQYDVAHVKWGDSWVMPSYYQLKELKDECHWEYVKDNVKGTDIGIRFTGPNGGSIILPLAGYCLDERHLNVGKQFGYYSSTQSYSYFTYYYHYLRFSTTDGLSLDYYEYSIGYSVRPVSMIKTSLVYPDLQLSQTQLSIVKGKSSTVEIIAGSGKYGVTSPNSSIAIASLSGTTITISGVAEGTAKIIVEDVQTNQQFFIDITVGSSSCPNNHHPHLIDLGLPSGTKWACCNIGAQKPEEYGGYFAWGETSEKEYYDWSSYTHCDGSSRTCHDIGKDIAGTQYDAATANWGSPWVMPSKVQMEELVKNCTSEWTTENGVNGRSFTGPNGVSIFLPAAGYRQRGDLLSTGACGVYWSSTLGKSDAYDAWDLYFLSGYVETPDDDRGYGLSVRPVRKN